MRTLPDTGTIQVHTFVIVSSLSINKQEHLVFVFNWHCHLSKVAFITCCWWQQGFRLLAFERPFYTSNSTNGWTLLLYVRMFFFSIYDHFNWPAWLTTTFTILSLAICLAYNYPNTQFGNNFKFHVHRPTVMYTKTIQISSQLPCH